MANQHDSPPAPKKPDPAPHPGGRPASDATAINLEQRGPIDPRMPNAPPA